MVENPRAVDVAIPDFVSQPSASKPINVGKEIPKEPKVQSFFLFIYSNSLSNSLLSSTGSGMQILNMMTSLKFVNNMQKGKHPESKPFICFFFTRSENFTH